MVAFSHSSFIVLHLDEMPCTMASKALPLAKALQP